MLLLACACTDTPIAPRLAPTFESLPVMECRVDVLQESVTCTDPAPATGAALGDLVGGQDRYLKLANSGNSYDAGADIFSMNVTVQNLLGTAFGTEDGSTVTGIYVFFYEEPTAPVTVANEDGTGIFFSGNAEYFLYNEILEPYEISASKQWRFNVPDGVTSFSFAVYADGNRQGSPATYQDAVWKGTVSTDWFTAGNWSNSAVPAASSVVNVPSAAILGSAFKPALTANASAMDLRVGTGDTLTLGGFTVSAGGNVDASGLITGGTLSMSGASAVLNGSVATLTVTGNVTLQGSTSATGPVTVTNNSASGASLTLSNYNTLTIINPHP
ncbi:MAG TPA: hypothetical protein VHG08_02320 [Longimicrobium sp.]|nr:hypothetical protein [Longimicrobium sp.]